MRLIDADVFEVVSFQGKSEEFANGVQWILEQIDMQPTAYDIDKVVEELKNQMPFCPTNSFTEGVESALLDAIEIVRQGAK